jgi:hypothetical protein
MQFKFRSLKRTDYIQTSVNVIHDLGSYIHIGNWQNVINGKNKLSSSFICDFDFLMVINSILDCDAV